MVKVWITIKRIKQVRAIYRKLKLDLVLSQSGIFLHVPQVSFTFAISWFCSVVKVRCRTLNVI